MVARLISRLLKNVHAGEEKLLWHHPVIAKAPETIDLRSDGFASGETMPARCGGKGVGDNVSPQLAWSGVPAGTVELVLIVEDSGVPLPKPFVHAIVYDIAPTQQEFAEAALSGETPPAGTFGRTTIGARHYAGPRPLPGHGPHTYSYQLLALDRKLSFDTPPKLKDVVAALGDSVIARGRLDGTFEQV